MEALDSGRGCCAVGVVVVVVVRKGLQVGGSLFLSS